MQDQQPAAIRQRVYSIALDCDVTELMIDKPSREFVMIAGDIDDIGAVTGLLQDFLHNIVVRLRPIPRTLQSPSINNIADQE